MKTRRKIAGRCLCGGVSISVDDVQEAFDVCHCSMCRRWGGGPAFTVDRGKQFEIKGKEMVSVYNSSDWAERGFCQKCGSHLFYHLKNTEFYNFPLGLFEGTDNFKFQSQIYIDRKPSHYEFANETETMTEAEVIAKFTAPT